MELDKNLKNEIKKQLSAITAKQGNINVLITGATGCGKSSTINALFGTEVAKVGVTPDPETMEIDKYILPGVVLWDSPGLGDGVENDVKHAKNIITKLRQNNDNGNGLIDVVLVIIDGSTRDMKTSFDLINKVIIPYFDKDRIIVAINKADLGMGGRYWDFEESRPLPKLQKFLEDKEQSVRNRIKADTDVDIWPISYVAGFKDDDNSIQEQPYNLLKLLHHLYMKTPVEKRAGYASVINQDRKIWESNDDGGYGPKIKDDFVERLTQEMKECGDIGGDIGEEIGEKVGFKKLGKLVGKCVGKAVGALKAVIASILPF